ncbi:hypothetical protein K353_00820 [Kitasatospora sp. SolWspMP-SS2h]|uniref:hypothetical protein n=1 Tax=Kitasatospora sp. SolWspMP-SS2h TaxID=1305729 RepID=UPI000DBF84F1|nr:hypothetical protein [Kitasatospora sp. SolWspMP-SS2h]RAJ46442.1 hypothetical protein K353_00820 [Kitasatospora sp. SolWspMP-SS2h]
MTEPMAGTVDGVLGGPSPAELRELVAAAGAAPSLHNTQPWRFRPTADGPGVLVFADPARAVPLADPDGRAMLLSVGAALFNLRVAAARLGLPVEELDLMPGRTGRTSRWRWCASARAARPRSRSSWPSWPGRSANDTPAVSRSGTGTCPRR